MPRTASTPNLIRVKPGRISDMAAKLGSVTRADMKTMGISRNGINSMALREAVVAHPDLMHKLRLPEGSQRNADNAIGFVLESIGAEVHMLSLHGSGNNVASIVMLPSFIAETNTNGNMPLSAKIKQEETETEAELFLDALEKTKAKIKEMADKPDLPAETREVVSTMDILISDPAVTDEIVGAIKGNLNNTRLAVETYISGLTDKCERLGFSTGKTKGAIENFLQMTKILLNIRYGVESHTMEQIAKLGYDIVLVAKDLDPIEVSNLPRNVKAVVTQEGSSSDHTRIILKDKELPHVFGVPINGIKGGMSIAVNPLNGNVVVNPSRKVTAEFQKLQGQVVEFVSNMASMEKNTITTTADGKEIHIGGNCGSYQDVERLLDDRGVFHGVSLFRTEVFYMSNAFRLERKQRPQERESVDYYSKIAAIVRKKLAFTQDTLKAVRENINMCLAFRTLDLGQDKFLPYFDLDTEKYPERGLPLCLSNPQVGELFREQLRYLLAASAGNPFLQILFPMVDTKEQFEAGKAVVMEEMQKLGDKGYNKDIAVGATLETPLAAKNAAEIAGVADFAEIGSNDMTQYTLGISRTSHDPSIRRRFDSLHPAVTENYRLCIDGFQSKHKMIGVCGDVATEALAIPVLIGLGVDMLSVPGSTIDMVKHTVRGLRHDDCVSLAADLTSITTAQDLRVHIRNFMLDSMQNGRWSGLNEPPMFCEMLKAELLRSAPAEG